MMGEYDVINLRRSQGYGKVSCDRGITGKGKDH